MSEKPTLASRLPPDIAAAPNDGSSPPEKVQTAALSFKVPSELAQGILNYLKTKPFEEVHQLIGGLMNCKQLKG